LAVGCGGENVTGVTVDGSGNMTTANARGNAVTVTIDGCSPRDVNGNYLATVEVNEGDLVVWSNDNGNDVTLYFDEALFGEGSVTIRDGKSVGLRVESGTDGNSYYYQVGCTASADGPAMAPNTGPKVNVGEGDD
jgi:plastocyanin